MKCPCCNAEMEIGNICARGGAGLYWLPQDERIKFIVSESNIEKRGGTILVDVHHIGDIRYPAYICSSCKKMLLEL